MRLRELGPRSFEEIPPQELAALVDHVVDQVGRDDEAALQRAALDLLGLKRLTDNVKKRLRALLTCDCPDRHSAGGVTPYKRGS